MAVVNIRGDYFRIWQENTVDQGYLKNSSMRFGEYLRGAGNFYVAEILIACNTSSIPSGSTVSSVTIDFDITVNNLSSVPLTASVHKQDKGSWTDTGSSPTYGTFANTAWASALTTLSVSNTPSTGNITFPTSAGLVSLVQDWVNGTGSASDGLILGINAAYFGWFLTGTVTNVNVTYTTAPTAVQGLKGTSNTFSNAPVVFFIPKKGLGGTSNTFENRITYFTPKNGLGSSSNTFELDLSKFNLQRFSRNYNK